ncbi:aspartate kinase [Patescibacteria group bacterium]|nr:aspartate kinase [Patescibacteria group bacterium]
MISTSEVVQSIIQKSPLLEDGLARGIINYSALARDLRPQIEKKLMKSIKRGAIVMALKRVSKSLKYEKQKIRQTINLSGLTIRSNLVEFTYANSDTMTEKPKQVFTISEKRKGVFCNISQGVRETMIVAAEEVEDEIKKIFKQERLIASIGDISAITILLNKESIITPGVYYSVLKLLAWNNINIIDVISTYSELTVIFDNKDIDKAFTILRNYNSNQ